MKEQVTINWLSSGDVLSAVNNNTPIISSYFILRYDTGTIISYLIFLFNEEGKCYVIEKREGTNMESKSSLTKEEYLSFFVKTELIDGYSFVNIENCPQVVIDLLCNLPNICI